MLLSQKRKNDFNAKAKEIIAKWLNAFYAKAQDKKQTPLSNLLTIKNKKINLKTKFSR